MSDQRSRESQQQKSAALEIENRQLRNELRLTRAERESAQQKYFEMVALFEAQVEERTRQALQWQRLLRRKEQEVKRLIDFSPAVVFYQDLKGRFRRVNGEFARLFGQTPPGVNGRTYADLCPGHPDPFRKGLLQVLESGQPLLERAVSLEGDGGPQHLLISRIPLPDTRGQLTMVIGFGLDVTRLHRSEEAQKALNERLEFSQKMEALGMVAGHVAHDLNNMLSAIVCYPDLILSQLPPDSPCRHRILTMQRSGQKAAAIVQDLLTLVRRGVPHREVVNLNELVSQYFASAEFGKLKSFHPGIEFITEQDPDLYNLLGSPVHLNSTVMNLTSNAAEAIPGRGIVRLTTRNERLDTPLAFPEFVLPAGSYCVLSIQDNGVGIAPSDQPRIFEPFFTKKTMGTSGTGLGMAVVRTTVLDHRGWIHLSSRPGEGTTFTIYLPATHEPLPRRKKAATLAELRGRNESVLVVDDSPEQREIASDVLHRLGYEVATVATGEDAIEYLRHQPMDLLMLNMIMDPGIDGLETYRRVLQFRPGQRAIIVSGFSETDRVVEARRLGAGAFLKKPYTAERLVSVIRSELDRRTN